MAEIAPSRSILFGSSKGFAPVPHVDMMNPFPQESAFLFEDINKLAGRTEPLRLTTMFSENGPKSSWSGLALGVKLFASELRSEGVAYQTADHKLGIAFPKHVEVVKPTGIGGERAQHLERCGQRMARIIERGELARLAEAYVASGKQINEQWLWDTFNTKSASGLRDILHEYSDALQSVMEETWKDLAFGKLPEKPLPSVDAPRERFTVSRGSMPIENVFQAVTAEYALSPAVHLTSMDKANIGAVLIIGAAANSGCTPIQAVTPTETVQFPSPKNTPEIPTDVKPTIASTEQKPDVTPTNPVAVGPEATPGASVSYPTELSAETIKNLIAATEPKIPASVSENVGVQNIVDRHTKWAKDAGLDFDTMQIHMAPDGVHWFVVPEKNGNIVGWLMIEDPSSQTGWRYAEQPTWDSKFDPLKDTFQFGLPSLRNAADHWDVVYADGFPVLTEVSANGEPQYWNSAVAKTMKEATGAVIEQNTNAIVEQVMADPWKATAEQKAAYDTFAYNEIYAMLKADGVANPETLSQTELLTKIAEHQQALLEKSPEGVIPDGYVVNLPFALLEEVRSDRSSLIAYHFDTDRGGGYGIGKDVTVTTSIDEYISFLLDAWTKSGRLDNVKFYGKQYVPNITELPMSGDLAFLYRVPGTDPSLGVGAMVQIYDGKTVHYRDAVIPLAAMPVKPGDMCFPSNGGIGACTTETIHQAAGNRQITMELLAEWMRKYKTPNIDFDGIRQTSVLWSDGALNAEQVFLASENSN